LVVRAAQSIDSSSTSARITLFYIAVPAEYVAAGRPQLFVTFSPYQTAATFGAVDHIVDSIFAALVAHLFGNAQKGNDIRRGRG